MSRLQLAALVALVAILLVGTAYAARPATPDERSAVAKAMHARPECVKVTISTVNEAWARGEGNPDAPSSCSDARGGNGFDALHHENGQWVIRYGSSEMYSCVGTGMPRAVGKDLHVCRDPRTYMLCADTKGTGEVRKRHPAECAALRPNDSFSQGANLGDLKWKHWADDAATATGVDRGFHRPYEHIPATVKAYRPRLDCRGDYLYTRLRISTRYGTRTKSYPTCP